MVSKYFTLSMFSTPSGNMHMLTSHPVVSLQPISIVAARDKHCLTSKSARSPCGFKTGTVVRNALPYGIRIYLIQQVVTQLDSEAFRAVKETSKSARWAGRVFQSRRKLDLVVHSICVWHTYRILGNQPRLSGHDLRKTPNEPTTYQCLPLHC